MNFIKRLLKNNILLTFLTWRVLLFIVAFLSLYFIPVFGARFPYYQDLLISTKLPYWIWGFGNFDGVHYLTIAKSGYSANFTQVFFPLYPLLVHFLSSNGNYLIISLILSNIFCLLSALFLYKLFLLDYDPNTSQKAILLLFLFPSAFYLGAVYSESLFILLTVLSFYFTRQKKFVLASIFAGFSSLTRIFGILLTPILILEFFRVYKFKDLRSLKILIKFLSLLIAPLGLISYMIYLQINFNNPLYFLSAQPVFGASRSSAPFILLPQVFYRYFKILTSVPILTLPFFNSLMELLSTLFVIFLIVISWKKVRLSYLIFSIGCLLLPTLTGTLSSMPRYALMSFLLFPTLATLSRKYLYLLGFLLIILQVIFLMMFIRGYWVA